MKYKGFVYRWTNKENNKMYVGSHVGSVDDGYVGSGKAFVNAIRKYGIQSFEREILEYVIDGNVKDVEQKYLTELDCAASRMYYNISPNADGGYMGADMSWASKRMKENNPNAGGHSRRKFLADGGTITPRPSPSADERKAISKRMKEKNPVSGVPAWRRDQATEQSLKVWYLSDVYYNWWVYNQNRSYYQMFQIAGDFEKYTIAHVNLVKKFKTGWIPTEDSDWVDFHTNYKESK